MPKHPRRVDHEGRRLCCWCGDVPVPKGRQTWCSQKCVDEYLERGNWNFIRKRIIDRDKVCQLCGGSGWRHTKPKRDYWHRPPVEYCPLQASWEVDHILSVDDGGTDDPANLRLLCGPCHKKRTAAWHAERARARRPTAQLFG